MQTVLIHRLQSTLTLTHLLMKYSLSHVPHILSHTHTHTHTHSHIHFIAFMFFSGADFDAVTPGAGLPVAKDDSSNTAILIGCLVGIILLLLAVIAVILWRQYWKKILGKAQGSLSSDELRVHLSIPSDNVVINNTHSYSSRYQRIHTFPDDRDRERCDGEGEYQEPSALLRPRDHTGRDSTGKTWSQLDPKTH
uniref:Uncharacterized protein n=1 Tax=Hucho hucho TaxID=62062 RepID=A0A4W5JRZ0_9TELE